MKRFLENLILVCLVVLLFSSFSFGSKFIGRESFLVSGDEVINEDLFVGAKRITIEGKVNGDLFFLAREILINGEVSGDIIGIAQTITINGVALDDVRVGAQILNINGKIQKNATLTGQYVNINKNSIIGGDFVCGGNDIKIDGVIYGEAHAGGETISMTGEIGKSAFFASSELFVSKTTTIKGDLKYRAKRTEIMKGANILGKVEKLILKERAKKLKWLSWKFYFWKIIFMIAGIIVGFIFVKLFPSLISKVKREVSQIWRSFGIGFALLVCIPILSVILAITILGLPLSLIIVALYLIFLYLGRIILASFVGEKILRKESPLLSLIVGMLIFTILFSIPFVGWLFNFIAITIGLGAFGVGSYLFFREIR